MKKGFTLIELLAVIVILAIIALITTPIVLGIIDDTKESAQIRSAEMYLKGVANAVMKENLEQEGNFRPTECSITSEGNLDCDDKEGILEVEVDGEKPKNGTITFEEGKIKEVRLEYQNSIIVKNEKGNLVYSEEPIVISLILDKTTITKEITHGQSVTESITATLNNATGTLNWTSSDSDVAEIVTKEGNTRTIELKKAGTAMITVTYEEDPKIVATCTVTVTEKKITLTLSPTTINEEVSSGGTVTKTLTATLNNATGTLDWTTSNSSVASVTGSGDTATVTLKAAGTATITVSYEGMVSATCTITTRGIGDIVIYDFPNMKNWYSSFSSSQFSGNWYNNASVIYGEVCGLCGYIKGANGHLRYNSTGELVNVYGYPSAGEYYWDGNLNN